MDMENVRYYSYESFILVRNKGTAVVNFNLNNLCLCNSLSYNDVVLFRNK